jgi:hypothetical protein
MKRLSFKQLVVFLLVFTLGISLCDAQDRAPKPAKKGLAGLFSGKKKPGTVKKPKSAGQTKKEQEKMEKKKNEAYVKSLKESQKRTVKIQTPEVQSRMKQNQKEIKDREKARMKTTSKANRNTGKKYKK